MFIHFIFFNTYFIGLLDYYSYICTVFNLIQNNMINKFQSFTGVEVIASLSSDYLLLVYDYITTNRFPLYVHKHGVFYSYQSCFIRGRYYFAVYRSTDLDLKSLLLLSNRNNVNLYIEYIDE